MAGALLLVGCATGTDVGSGKRYGVRPGDAIEAVGRGEGRAAMAYYESRAAELERGGKLSKAEAARTYGAAARAAAALGAYQKSLQYGLRAQAILEEFPDYQEVLEGKLQICYGLGQAYLAIGDLAAARRQFGTCIEMTKRSTIIGVIRAWSAGAWGGLAAAAYLEGNYEEAVASGKTSVRFREEHLNYLGSIQQWFREYSEVRRLNLAAYAFDLIVLGRAQWELKRLDDAEASLRRALEAASEIGSDLHLTIARAALAEVIYSRGDFSRAEKEAIEARRQSQRLGLSFFTILMLSRGASRLAEQGRHTEALDRYREAVQLVEEARSGLQEAGLRSLFLEDKQKIYHGAVQSALALGRADEAFSFAERGRARAFLDLLGNQTTLSKGKTRALVEEEVRLRGRLSEAQALAQDVTGLGDATRARQRVETAEREYRAFLDRVRKENL